MKSRILRKTYPTGRYEFIPQIKKRFLFFFNWWFCVNLYNGRIVLTDKFHCQKYTTKHDAQNALYI